MKMTTEEAFVKVLQMHGIEHAFGIIGSAMMPVSDLFPKAGITKRDFLRGGTVELDDKPVRYLTPAEAVADGIVYVTEDRKTEGFFDTMSVAENLFGGKHKYRNDRRRYLMHGLKRSARIHG